MIDQKDILRSLAEEASIQTQEEMLEVGRKTNRLYIGIPKEVALQEKRVPLIPEAVALLVSHGHEVVVEHNAGVASNFQDNDYSEAGAKIAYDQKEVYEADILLKIAPPTPDEILYMSRRQTLLSALQLTVQSKEYFQKLINKCVTAVAWDFIQDEANIFPVIRSMGEIAGNTSILVASEMLSNAHKGKGMMLGGIAGVQPAEVVILGAGTVGEYAARAALGLGAEVRVFDDSIYKLRRLQHILGNRIPTSIIKPNTLKSALQSADVVIGALRATRGRTPCVVTEEMVSSMKHGSVVVDVSIDQGGCFETSEVTTHDDPIFQKYGVFHYCVPNIASRVCRTASHALSNIFTPILLRMGEEGSCKALIKNDTGFRNGVYLYNGTLTNRVLGEVFDLPYKEIELLAAAM